MAYKLATACRDDPSWQDAWEEQLAPKALWHGLILPDDPPRLLSPAMKRAQERPASAPEPSGAEPPQATTAEAIPEPEPRELPEQPGAAPEAPEDGPDTDFKPLTFGDAIRAVYDMSPDRRTCDTVADILDRCPLAERDRDGLRELTQQLAGCAQWHLAEIESLAHTFAIHSDGPLLFCTAEEVLVYEGPENGLQIFCWNKVAIMMEPYTKEAKRRRKAEQGGRDVRGIGEHPQTVDWYRERQGQRQA
jgi:hypothetical protein